MSTLPNQEVLNVNNLKTYFYTLGGVIKAVNDVSFNLLRGETTGLVGESGSGKTVTALSIMRLIRSPGKILEGSINLEGQGNILSLSEEEMRSIRGSRIAMTFQDPMTYLNPVLKVGDQVSEAIMIHQNVSKTEAIEKTIDILNLVKIPEARKRVNEYPHQMSGGMRQRILIAIAISCRPSVLIADEPTTALDVIVQREILDLLKDLKQELGTSMLLITHDLAIVAEVTEKVIVMYAGRLCESAKTETIFKDPKHPYTRSLLKAIPRPDTEQTRLATIKGNIPRMTHIPSGCVFHPRCPYMIEECKNIIPEMESVEAGHLAACIRLGEI
jgi:peptide/nickel transport system ATP-binding protein/oligopeptide transport system ATP-binding protein